MFYLIIYIIRIAAAWLIADLLSGLAHWILDTQLEQDGPFSELARDNELHHERPEAMLSLTISENLSTSLILVPIALVLCLLGAPLEIWLSVWFLFWANLVHRWAHERRAQLPRVVRKLQKWGIFQSPAHHALHHRAGGHLIGRKDSFRNYCVMSNYVNWLMNHLIPR